MFNSTLQSLDSRHIDRSIGRWSARAAALLTASMLSLPLWATGYTGAGDYTGDTGDYYEESDNSYSFARVLEGSATLLTTDGEREEVEIHQPVLVGDRLWVPHNARLELVLADRSLLRVEGDSDLSFESIAYSADTGDRHTLLRLHKGHAQLVVPHDVLGDSLPRIETPSASVFIHREGTFRLTVGRDGAIEVVVREGLAELVAERGSRLVHTGEVGWGSDRSGIQVSQARYRDGLERWGDDLSYRAARVDTGYVDDSLRYVAEPLAKHGGWLQVGGRNAWRPHSRHTNWRPYDRGYWRHTPIGATWVSHDPWGWVTHHYGSWDYDNGHGWLWYPGRRYAPARVHWYWGPKYVGWCPTGYYSNYYRRHRSGYGLNVGIYGWAGGNWGHFNNWNFTANVHFGHRRQHRQHYSGAALGRRGHRLDVGVVTTHPGRHYRRGRSANEIYASLRTEAGRHRQVHGNDLPDVTEFVGRTPMRDRVANRVLRPRDANKPLAIAGGTAAAPRPNGRRDGASSTDGGRTRADVPRQDGTRRQDATNATRGRRDTRAPLGTSADKPARRTNGAESANRQRRREADKPAVTTPSRDRRTATTPSYDRRGRRSTEGTTEERRPYAPTTPRATPDRPDRRPATQRRDVRPNGSTADKPGRADARAGEARTSRPRGTVRQDAAEAVRRSQAERANAERRRNNERQRAGTVRQTPRTTRPSTVPQNRGPRTTQPRATQPRTTQPRAAQPRATQPPRSRGNNVQRDNNRGTQQRRVAPAPRQAPTPRANTPRQQRPANRSVQPNRSNTRSNQGNASRGNNGNRRPQANGNNGNRRPQASGNNGNQRPRANGNNNRGRRDGNNKGKKDNNRRRDNG